jgi:hypothetical protein
MTLLHGECFYIPLSYSAETGNRDLTPAGYFPKTPGNKIINFLINQLLAVPLMPGRVICALLTKTTA